MFHLGIRTLCVLCSGRQFIYILLITWVEFKGCWPVKPAGLYFPPWPWSSFSAFWLPLHKQCPSLSPFPMPSCLGAHQMWTKHVNQIKPLLLWIVSVWCLRDKKMTKTDGDTIVEECKTVLLKSVKHIYQKPKFNFV